MLETTLPNLSVPLGLTFAIQLLSNDPKVAKNKNKKINNKESIIKTKQKISNPTLGEFKRRVLV